MQIRKQQRLARWVFTAIGSSAILAGFWAQAADEPKKDEPPKKAWQQLRPERLVSDNTLLYLSLPDMKKALAAYERSAFKGLLNEEEINAPVMAAFSKLRDTYVKGDGTRSEADLKRRNEEADLLMKAAPLFDGQLAIAISADAQALAGVPRGMLPGFVLIASMPSGEAGPERQAALEELMDHYRANLVSDPHNVDISASIGPYTVRGIENRELGVVEAWSFVENLFIYGQGKGMVEDAVARYAQHDGVGALALNAGYQSSFKQVGRDDQGESLLYLQADAQPLLGADNQLLSKMLSAGGAANRPQIAMGVQVGSGENAPIRERLLVRAKKELGANENCKSISARFAASDALFYKAAQASLSECYTAYKGWLANTGIEPRLMAALDAKGSEEIASKLSIFKGEMSFSMDFAPKSSGKNENWLDWVSQFQMVLAMELNKDDTAAEQTLNGLITKLEAGTGQQYVKTTYGGVVLHYQRGAQAGEERSGAMGLFANLAAAEQKNSPFFMAYAKVELESEAGGTPHKFLLLSDDLNALKKAVAQMSMSRTSLAECASFRELGKSFREARYELSYLNLDRLLNVYNAVLPLARKVEEATHQDFKMPNVGALRPHLFPMAWAQSALSQPDGTLVECSSPTGNLPLLGMTAAVAWPTFNAARQRAVSAEVDQKFKQILLGLSLYAADFDRFPARLSDLVPTYIKDVSVFESPFKRGALAAVTDIDKPDLSNLVYVPNKSLFDLGKEILLYEREPTRIVGSDYSKLLYHVLTLDGKVKGLPRVALDRALNGKAEVLSSDAQNVKTVAPR